MKDQIPARAEAWPQSPESHIPRAARGANGNWFVCRRFDLALFHIPVWLGWLAVLLAPASWKQASLPLWVWVGAVLLVDVGHVWSSLYRTYLDPLTRRHRRRLLLWTPIICMAACLAVAAHSDQLFWRVLAYVAVFHFIKQQVGITALYRYRSRRASGDSAAASAWQRLARVDKLAVYTGTLFPVIFWHLFSGKNISWFIPGDFISLAWLRAWLMDGGILGPVIWYGAAGLFLLIWIGVVPLWLAAHWRFCRRYATAFPLGKALWVLGTWFNWLLGIVIFDSDLVFTLTNVIAHGVPYYGLIGLYGYRKLRDQGYGRIGFRLPGPGLALTGVMILFLAPILFLAFAEEFLWSFLLYREHLALFQVFGLFSVEAVSDPLWKAWWLALLSMPQVIHYVLDGFIWKFDGSNPDLARYLFPQPG